MRFRTTLYWPAEYWTVVTTPVDGPPCTTFGHVGNFITQAEQKLFTLATVGTRVKSHETSPCNRMLFLQVLQCNPIPATTSFLFPPRILVPFAQGTKNAGGICCIAVSRASVGQELLLLFAEGNLRLMTGSGVHWSIVDTPHKRAMTADLRRQAR